MYRIWLPCVITIFGYSVISEIFKMVFKSGFTGTWSIVASLLDSLSQTWGSTAEHSYRAYLKVRFSVNFQLIFSTRVPAEIYICSTLKRFDVQDTLYYVLHKYCIRAIFQTDLPQDACQKLASRFFQSVVVRSAFWPLIRWRYFYQRLFGNILHKCTKTKK